MRSTRSPPTRSCVGGDYEVLADPELLFGSQNVVMTVDSEKLDGRWARKKFLAVVDAVNRRLTQDGWST